MATGEGEPISSRDSGHNTWRRKLPRPTGEEGHWEQKEEHG